MFNEKVENIRKRVNMNSLEKENSCVNGIGFFCLFYLFTEFFQA